MIKLVRLDYRLLHGQVVFSWTGHVGAQRIIVVDDDAANDEMKKSALLLSKPAGVRVNIFTVDKAIAKMPKVEQLDEKIMMIFGNTAALLKFCQAYPKIKEINYGAVANKPGSVAFDQSVFLTPEEQADTQKLLDMGIKIYSQQTPTFKVVPGLLFPCCSFPGRVFCNRFRRLPYKDHSKLSAGYTYKDFQRGLRLFPSTYEP